MNFPAVFFLLSSYHKRKAGSSNARKKQSVNSAKKDFSLFRILKKIVKTFFSIGENKTISWISSFLFLFFALFLLLSQKNFFQKKNFPDSPPVLGFRELIPSPKPYPVNKGIYLLPELTAKSIFIVDVDSAVVLYQQNADLKLLPASTTKMMTALVVLDQYPLDKVLTVGQLKIDGSKIGLLPGEQITVENLLYALLVGSANDAAEVLAQNYPGGEAGFVLAMNQKAADLKLENTHFSNPIGLDDKDHYSTAKDLGRLAVVFINQPVLAKIVATPEIVISDTSGTIKHNLKNTNELIGKVEGVKGIKTGWTQNAGECLVTLVEKGGHRVVIVVLESKSRFTETQSLINWVFGNFDWLVIAPTMYQ